MEAAVGGKCAKSVNFRHLLVTLIVLFITQPLFVDTGVLTSSLLNLVLIVSLAVAATSVRGASAMRTIVYSIGSIAFLSSWVAIIWVGHFWLQLIVFASYLSFFGLVCASVLGHVLDGSEVNTNKLYAVCCVYLLAGIAWAFLYAITEMISPGSFRFPVDNDPAGMMQRLIYFSLVTLTTLGYGDISPISQFARTVAALEAIFGQAYLAVLVARVVGWHVPGRKHR